MCAQDREVPDLSECKPPAIEPSAGFPILTKGGVNGLGEDCDSDVEVVIEESLLPSSRPEESIELLGDLEDELDKALEGCQRLGARLSPSSSISPTPALAMHSTPQPRPSHCLSPLASDTRNNALSGRSSEIRNGRKRPMCSPGSACSAKSCKSSGKQTQQQFAAVPEFGEAATCPEDSIAFQEESQADELADIKTAAISQDACVRSLDDAMAWPQHHTDVLLRRAALSRAQGNGSDSDSDSDLSGDETGLPRDLRSLINKFDEVPMSTAFSGIDAPGTGLCQQVAELNVRSVASGKRASKPVHLNACEWYGPSQRELLSHPCKPHCLFSDITQFLTPYLQGLFPQLVRTGKLLQVLKPLVSAPESITMPGSQSIIDAFGVLMQASMSFYINVAD